MTADFSCPCGTTATVTPTEDPTTFDATVRRHFTGDHS